MGSVLPGCALLASDVRLLRDEVESPRRRLASEVAMSDDAELRFACEGMVGVEGGVKIPLSFRIKGSCEPMV
jgi:hypothetical protein